MYIFISCGYVDLDIDESILHLTLRVAKGDYQLRKFWKFNCQLYNIYENDICPPPFPQLCVFGNINVQTKAMKLLPFQKMIVLMGAKSINK